MSDTLVLKVEGMDCGGCEQSIARALEPLEGVAGVRASHAEGRVEVDGNADPTKVREAIEAAGYEVVAD